MHIDFLMTDRILIARVAGEIDHHSAKQLRNEIDGTYEVFQSRHIILDFTKVTFMDSSGIGVVLGRYNVVNETGGSIVICGCSDYVHSILHMSGVFTIIMECANIVESIGHLKDIDPECTASQAGQMLEIEKISV